MSSKSFVDKFLESYWPMIMVVLLITVLLIYLVPSPSRGIIEHQMTDGVVCYTFNTSIDCLQVGE